MTEVNTLKKMFCFYINRAKLHYGYHRYKSKRKQAAVFPHLIQKLNR